MEESSVKEIKITLTVEVPKDFDKTEEIELDTFLVDTIESAGYELVSSGEYEEL